MVWLVGLGRIALGGSVLVVLAALLGRQLSSAVGQRTVWRAVVVGLAILLLLEASGASDWLVEGVFWRSHHAAGEESGRLAPRVETLSRSEGTTLPLPASDQGLSTPKGESAAPDQAELEAGGIWWPGAVWLAGTLILLIRGLLGRGLLVVFRFRHPASGDTALRERVRTVAERLSFRRSVRVLEVSGLRGPVAFGIVRPTIAVPADFTSYFDAPRQEVMLTHEAAHLAARDPAWLLLADLVSALIWWQPLIWWARQRLRTASESAADEASLLLADGPALLAECLVELGARLAAPSSISWLGMAGNGFRSGLGRRVERLLHLQGLDAIQFRLRSRLAVLLAVAAISNICAILSTAWVLDQRFEEGDEPMGSMQRSWRRSLAATFLLAVLAPANDATPAEEPPATPAAGAGGESKESRELDQTIQNIKTQIIDLDVRRTALRQHTAGDTKPIKELDEQIRRLEEQKQRLLDEQQEKARNEKQIRVFRLKHVKPEEVREAVENLLGAPASHPAAGHGGMMMKMGGKPMGPGMMAPGAGGKMPPGMGGSGGGAPPAAGAEGVSPNWRLTVDERTRSIIIRGSREDLRRAAEVIALLDLPAGKAAPKTKNMRAFKLKHAEAAKIAVILDELGLDARVLSLEGTNRVIVAGTEAAVKEAADLIEQLDVDARGGENDVGKDPLRSRP
jgi:beta-lactamase regulating signal transducer with metallopeptidase domain